MFDLDDSDEWDDTIETEPRLPGFVVALSPYMFIPLQNDVTLYSTVNNFRRFIGSVSGCDFTPFVKRHLGLSDLWLREVERDPAGEAGKLFTFPVDTASEYKFVRRSDDPARRSRQHWRLLDDDTPDGLLYRCEQAHKQGEDFEIW